MHIITSTDMASNLESSLRVSLHASEDLRRSLHSSSGLGSSSRLGTTRWGEGQGLHESLSSDVSLWSSTISSNTWPRSPRSALFSDQVRSPSRFRSSQTSITKSCLLHAHGDRPEVCPFDGSKYLLKPLSSSHSPRDIHSSLPSSPASSSYGSPSIHGGTSFSGVLGTSQYDQNAELSYRVGGDIVVDDGLDEVMAELDEVFHGSTHKAALYSEVGSGQHSRGSMSNCTYSHLNGHLWDSNRGLTNSIEDGNFWIPEESFLDRASSCLIKGSPDSRKVPSPYGNLSSSSTKFPSRISLQSTGSHEAETSGSTDKPKAMTNGRKFRMQIEAKYEKYRETCEY